MPYNIHLKPEVHTLRVFKDNDSYSGRSIPVLSATLHYISDTEVYICNLVGQVDRHIMRSICYKLYLDNYRILRYERNYKLKTVDLNKYYSKLIR